VSPDAPPAAAAESPTHGELSRWEGAWRAALPLAPGGLPLHQRRWEGRAAARAAVVLVHGIGGHSGLFDSLAVALVAQGLRVFSFDLPGHGRSAGARGVVRSWLDLRCTLEQFLSHELEPAAAGLPCLLLGHSLGGAVVLEALLADAPAGQGVSASPLGRRLAGVVLTNPALSLEGVAPWRLGCGRLLSSLWPSFTLDTGFPLELACRDPERLELYRRDPLRHSRGCARLATELEQVCRRLQGEAPRFDLPLLLLQSGADGVTPPAAAERFFASLPPGAKTWHAYPDSRHELFDDLDRAHVLADLARWIDQLLPPWPTAPASTPYRRATPPAC
jgi:alpha-beta hydrolase superfamily lysophospholipase